MNTKYKLKSKSKSKLKTKSKSKLKSKSKSKSKSKLKSGSKSQFRHKSKCKFKSAKTSKSRNILRNKFKKGEIFVLKKEFGENECEFSRNAYKIGISPKIYKCKDGIIYIQKLQSIDESELFNRKFEIFELILKGTRKGMIHLDPGAKKRGYNVMKTYDGKLLLIDWGDAEYLNEHDNPFIVASNTFLNLWNRVFFVKVKPHQLRQYILEKYKLMLPELSRERISRIRKESQENQRRIALTRSLKYTKREL